MDPGLWKKKRNRNCWGEDEEAKIKSLVKSGMDLLRQLTHSQACLQIRQQTFFLSGFSKGSFLHGVRKNESLAWSLCPPHSSLKWAGVEGGKKRSVDLMEFKRLRRDQSQSISLLEFFFLAKRWSSSWYPPFATKKRERKKGGERKKEDPDRLDWMTLPFYPLLYSLPDWSQYISAKLFFPRPLQAIDPAIAAS